MLIREACRTLQQALQASGQALDRLDPWEAWRDFKAFLQREVEDARDVGSMQFLPLDPDDDEADEACLFLVRQFSERTPGTGADEPIGRVVLELRFAATHFQALQATDLWTLDFPTLEEWASVVEGQPAFQEAMARTPLFTEVYYEDGSDEAG